MNDFRNCKYCGKSFISNNNKSYCKPSHRVMFCKVGAKITNFVFEPRFNNTNYKMKILDENFDVFFINAVQQNKKVLYEKLENAELKKLYPTVKVNKISDTEKLSILTIMGYNCNVLIKKDESEFIVGDKALILSKMQNKHIYEQFSKKYTILRCTTKNKIKPYTNEMVNFISFASELFLTDFRIPKLNETQSILILKMFLNPIPTKIHKVTASGLVLKNFIEPNLQKYVLTSYGFNEIFDTVLSSIKKASYHLSV